MKPSVLSGRGFQEKMRSLTGKQGSFYPEKRRMRILITQTDGSLDGKLDIFHPVSVFSCGQKSLAVVSKSNNS
jgi:hypothetical protein